MIPYWFLTRPHRRLAWIPQSIACFREVAELEVWAGNKPLQKEFQAALEREGLKAEGKERGGDGSSGRTHAALLRSLGLFFEDEDSGVVRLTLAGQALADGEPPQPVLTRQVLAHQFPSVHSRRIQMDERFKLRPFVLLLRLLLREDLAGLSQEEIALRVLTLAERDTSAEAERIAKEVLRFRAMGDAALEFDFDTRFVSSRAEPANLRSALNDIANTFVNWLEYTGLIERAEGRLWIPDSRRKDAEAAIQFYDKRPLEPTHAEKFQRMYGVTPGRRKDGRRFDGVGAPRSKIERRIQTVLVGMGRTRLIDHVSPDLVAEVAGRTGFAKDVVERALARIIPDERKAQDAFLSNFSALAFSGTEEATEFEKATAELFRRFFGLDAEWVGKQGKSPDVVIRSADDGWVGIVDAKAYATYSLPSDHRLRMAHNYIPRYANEREPLAFFNYVAGGLSTTISAGLDEITNTTKPTTPGSAISAHVLIELARRSPVDHDTLRSVFQLGREILVRDLPAG